MLVALPVCLSGWLAAGPVRSSPVSRALVSGAAAPLIPSCCCLRRQRRRRRPIHYRMWLFQGPPSPSRQKRTRPTILVPASSAVEHNGGLRDSMGKTVGQGGRIGPKGVLSETTMTSPNEDVWSSFVGTSSPISPKLCLELWTLDPSPHYATSSNGSFTHTHNTSISIALVSTAKSNTHSNPVTHDSYHRPTLVHALERVTVDRLSRAAVTVVAFPPSANRDAVRQG